MTSTLAAEPQENPERVKDSLRTHIESQYGADYFQDRFAGRDPKREASYRLELEQITKLIDCGRVLDVGCGMGGFLSHFDSEKWDRFGIEVSPYAAQEAEARGISVVEFDYDGPGFDLVVMRGVLQHLETPLESILRCIDMLNPGGFLVFLATPNTHSIHYKLFEELPMLDATRNFLLPSDKMLTQILVNYGLDIVSVRHPYLESPYSSPVLDHLKFIGRLFGIRRKFAFWGNMMECYAQKPLSVSDT